MTARSALLAALLSALLLVGCQNDDYRPKAYGPEGEVVVVIDSSQWEGPVGETLRRTLGADVPTLPVPEPIFDLTVMELDNADVLDRIKQRKNVVFVAPLSDSTSESDFLRRRLDAALLDTVEAGMPLYVERPELWRRDQMVIYLTADSVRTLANEIARSSTEMVATFNDITRERVREEMFEKGRQFQLEDTLMRRHGFTLNMQHDYQVAYDTMNTIWLRRIVSSESWRSLLIHYIDGADPSQLTPEWIKTKQDSLTQRYMKGNRAGFLHTDYRRPLEMEQRTFLGRYAYEMRGLWSMVQHADSTEESFQQLGMGGPFLTYAFYDRPTNRIYFLMGSVFAPNYGKREFLRQMEVIAHTFRTQPEVEQQKADA